MGNGASDGPPELHHTSPRRSTHPGSSLHCPTLLRLDLPPRHPGPGKDVLATPNLGWCAGGARVRTLFELCGAAAASPYACAVSACSGAFVLPVASQHPLHKATGSLPITIWDRCSAESLSPGNFADPHFQAGALIFTPPPLLMLQQHQEMLLPPLCLGTADSAMLQRSNDCAALKKARRNENDAPPTDAAQRPTDGTSAAPGGDWRDSCGCAEEGSGGKVPCALLLRPCPAWCVQALPHSGWLPILMLTCWVCSSNSSTVPLQSARSHQIV